MNIDSVETAKQLTGCTQITGSLEIQIRGGSKFDIIPPRSFIYSDFFFKVMWSTNWKKALA